MCCIFQLFFLLIVLRSLTLYASVCVRLRKHVLHRFQCHGQLARCSDCSWRHLLWTWMWHVEFIATNRGGGAPAVSECRALLIWQLLIEALDCSRGALWLRFPVAFWKYVKLIILFLLKRYKYLESQRIKRHICKGFILCLNQKVSVIRDFEKCSRI